jgi:ABC-type xylose transport system permease subunit
MVKGLVLSSILSRYSVFMALKAADQKLRAAARAGEVPVIVGVAAGVIVGWLIAGLIGSLVGGVMGAFIVDAYRPQ